MWGFIMKHKVVISLFVVALLLATVGVAAAAPAEASRTDTVIGDVKSINGTIFTLTTKERGDRRANPDHRSHPVPRQGHCEF